MLPAQVGPPIPLANLLSKFVNRGFNELFKLLDENSGDESQKRSLMRVLNMIYILGTKCRMAFMFNNEYQNSEELVAYFSNCKMYGDYLTKFAEDLWRFRDDMWRMMTPRYDIEQAIDILVGNCTVRLPLDIFPKKPRFEQDPAPFFTILNGILKSKVLTLRIPANMRVRFRKGRAICTVRNQYRLYISATKRDDKLVIVPSKLEFLVPQHFSAYGSFAQDREEMKQQQSIFIRDSIGHMLRNGNDLAFQNVISDGFISRTLAKITEFFEAHDFFQEPKRKRSAAEMTSVLTKTNDFMQRVLLILAFQRLRGEAIRLLGTKLGQRNTNSDHVYRYYFWYHKHEFSLELGTSSINIEVNGMIIGDAQCMSLDIVLAMCMRHIAVKILESFKTELSGIISDIERTSDLYGKCSITPLKVTIDTEAAIPYVMCGKTRFIIDQRDGLIRCPGNRELSHYSISKKNWKALGYKLARDHCIEEQMTRQIKI